MPAELRGLSEIDQEGLLTNMFRYAHSTQTGKLRLVSILQNIRRTNIDRLVAISYQIRVVDNTSRTGTKDQELGIQIYR